MLKERLINFGIKKPKTAIILSVLITLFFLGAFPSLTVDTDPEHMLPHDDPAIVMYDQIKEEFNINDMVVVGVNSVDGSSLFTPERLSRIYNIVRDIKEIREEPASNSSFMKFFRKLQFLKKSSFEQQGSEIFDKTDIMSVGSSDDITLNDKKELLLSPIMKVPPRSQKEADEIFNKVQDNPFFRNKLVSSDGSLISIFIPINKGKKDRTYYLSTQLKKIAERRLSDSEKYYITGLPVAETTFGTEMFIQMGIYAPAAGLLIFIILALFFGNIRMVAAPMALAIMSVIWAMGTLIYAGQTIHIMSSMIPIFLMPIAVLDSVHILSSFYENINKFKDKETAVRKVMNELYSPMLFTSITTFVGFSSLSTTGIPPVVVFGLIVGFGVLSAWALSMVFMPAYVMLMSEKSLVDFGVSDNKRVNIMDKPVEICIRTAKKTPRTIIFVSIVLLVVSVFGIRKIIINDNPVRWFKQNHEIRQADELLNKKIAGTYLANLYFKLSPEKDIRKTEDNSPVDEFDESAHEVDLAIRNPELIAYMKKISSFLNDIKDEEGNTIIGGSTSIVDTLSRVGKVAFESAALPESKEKISQYMFMFESGDSKGGRDMWKLITADETNAAQIWVFFKNGDNQNMNKVINSLEMFMKNNPPPVIKYRDGGVAPLDVKWAGLTYINKVWQDQMVKGMTYSLVSSFGIVFIMMTFLFRSLKWGFIAMLPLTLTITVIYGFIGYVGKFYDMPIAVLSSLTLGLSIDFAIHFIQSYRQIKREHKLTDKALDVLFGDTAKAIWRNVIVISLGFLPLILASLVPYVTVGSFFLGIMLISGVSTLILLPAIIKVFHKTLPA